MFHSLTRPTLIWAIFLLLLASGCSRFKAVNRPLAEWTPESLQRVSKQVSGNRSPGLLVFVAFSGGGTRAAAFAYGVLQELAATKLTTEAGERRVIDEIDVISSVSGGSFTSAYFGLRGDGIFDEFEGRFLRKNIQGSIFAQALRPLNWFRLLSRTFGRSDLAAEYYDEHVFDGATFADLDAAGGPTLAINATDLDSSSVFTFVQSEFDMLCSDLSPMRVSQAVTASSAVPGVFAPLTIENRGGTCDYVRPAWVEITRNLAP